MGGVNTAMVSRLNGVCFGTFCGTLPPSLDMKSINDWVSNILPSGMDYVCGGKGCCKVRSAFVESYFETYEAKFRNDLHDYIYECTSGGGYGPVSLESARNCIVLSGFSQGGAIAQVAAIVFAEFDPWVFTFGQPAYMGDLRSYRYINTVVDYNLMKHDVIAFSPGLGASDFG